MNLIKEVLEMISKENLATPTMLAQQLNVSQSLVKMMLADLERAGYIRPVADDGSRCASCGIRERCKTPAPHLWVRTDK